MPSATKIQDDFTPRNDIQTNRAFPTHNSKWVAVAALVTTVVAAATAVYFGSQVWHSGASLMGNIHNLMGSIPFDATFLAGCASGLIGLIAIVYCLCQKGASEDALAQYEDIPPSNVNEQEEIDLNVLTPENYTKVARQITCGIITPKIRLDSYLQANKQNLAWLASNYSLMLEALPEIPDSIIAIVEEVYQQNMGQAFIQAVNKKIESLNGPEDKEAWITLFNTIKVQCNRQLINIVYAQMDPQGQLFNGWLRVAGNTAAFLTFMHAPIDADKRDEQIKAQVTDWIGTVSLPAEHVEPFKQVFVQAITKVKANPSDFGLQVAELEAQLKAKFPDEA